MNEQQTETLEPPVEQPADTHDVRPAAPPPESHKSTSIAPAGCATCGTAGPTGLSPNGGGTVSYVYAIGRIEARFPRVSVEKEFAQATGRADTAGKTDQQAFHEVLGKRENRYLARHLCWVMTIQGMDTYILQPRDVADIDLLIQVTAPLPNPWLSTVIGLRGGVAPPEMCNGLMVPIVFFDQFYTYTEEAIIKSIPRPEKIPAKEFEVAARELFERLIGMTDNAGATDEHRALNYLCMRYPGIYSKASEAHARNCSLSGVEVRPSALSGTRSILEVIFSYTDRSTDFTEKCFVRVDVTEEFPFLVTKLLPYYDR